ncbi:hypothetical protein KC221_25485, partial [Mycobacterium tuberculosis]|nr:hypothetical protein [Mycobacterium tuberculosis]
LGARATRWGELVATLALAMAGVAILAIANAPRWSRRPEDAPSIFRPPVDPFARRYVLFFACVPALVLTLLTALFGFSQIAGGAGTVL